MNAASSNPSEERDPIASALVEEVVRGTCGKPFDVLGPHRVHFDGSNVTKTVVRAFLPGARAARVIPLAADSAQRAGTPMESSALGMSPLHNDGLFTAITSFEESTRYIIEVTYEDGTSHQVQDAYAFSPQLSDFDLYLLGEGTDYRTYDHLGAHPRGVDGVDGVLFAVWAPNARRMSVVGDFNQWDERKLPMRLRAGGVWELFVPGVAVGSLYKFALLSWQDDFRAFKADPYAFAAELRPGTASRVCDLSTYSWSDSHWMQARLAADPLKAPITIYELHVGSWRPDPGTENNPRVTYRELAHQLVPYLRELGYTHVELMPIMEHPLDASWGYQVTGYFAPTSRFGAPQDFMYFVDHCHQNGIGVLLDWVPAHFPKDDHGLHFFDGSHLYEYADPRLGEHPDWGTVVFDYGRKEVVNFLLANALFWLERYHIDGLRVDAVASMLYLDYSRKPGEWLPNRFGGRENLEAVAFVRRFNELIHGRFPGCMTIAEESTAWAQVSRPTYVGGLGFTFKWNMGWMHDILQYMAHDPVHRRYHHNTLTFSLMYAFSENFVLPFSHDEVVHLKASMLSKMPGDTWQQFANLRMLYAYMYAHPGKKLLFMGGEFGQPVEWSEEHWLQWQLLEDKPRRLSRHGQLRRLIADLNHLLLTSPGLYELDSMPVGFEWIDCNDADNSVIAFVRSSSESPNQMLVACNFTPLTRYDYRVGVPSSGFYAEVFNSDAQVYGGSNVGNQGGIWSESIESHGRQHSIALTLPPLAAVMLLRRDDPPLQGTPRSAIRHSRTEGVIRVSKGRQTGSHPVGQ